MSITNVVQAFRDMPAEARVVDQNLAQFPDVVRCRGVFFTGLTRIAEKARGPAALARLLARAECGANHLAFKWYPHADFYRLYYLAARELYPKLPFAEALREVAQTFFPIFRESLLGKTLTAFMGKEPPEVLPLLAKAYDISIEGNRHELKSLSGHEAIWTATVEPVVWYPATFEGIVRGALPSCRTLEFEHAAPASEGPLTTYVFRLHW
jgi:uncharacterized protein (TIGR02265 family)